jgi:hypothetical protein
MGGADKTTDFFRLFMVPGMGHCGGGPGPNTFDALGALDQWVEHGKAPEKIIASHIANGVTDRTRPLCPYPQVARRVALYHYESENRMMRKSSHRVPRVCNRYGDACDE